MNRRLLTYLILLVLSVAGVARSQSSKKLEWIYADKTEFSFSDAQDTIFWSGNVIFETETGLIYCDSAIMAVDSTVILRGRVIVDEEEYHLAADSVQYDLNSGRSVAVGEYLELWSYADSLFAVGTHAFFDRDRNYFYMLRRPTVYLNYPDTSRMIEIIADHVVYDAGNSAAEAEGDVRISSLEFNSTSGCAVMHPDNNSLELFDSPTLRRKGSEVSGRFIAIESDETNIRSVDVIDSAHADFIQPAHPGSDVSDKSILSGQRILMDFLAGDLRTVTCYDQAYSWYYPADLSRRDQSENSVSGDTIRFTVSNEQLRRVDVVGGGVGSYLTTKTSQEDSVVTVVTDTVDYKADYISYNLEDSMISLNTRASTSSGGVRLKAFRIQFDTRERIIEAYSGDVATEGVESDNQFVERLQPNTIPVMLKDGDQNLVGDYLRYSIETEKGRIVTSKSDYETGFFYGEDLYRQQRDIFYLKNGRYTTCNADEPHFHFKSSNLKLINGKKLIARPVVLNLGRLPILALPYYVFPLEKGRHSGILPFSLGNIEKGERYIRNVGYYWAASEYWDWQGALDYFEYRDRLNFFSRINYRKRYAFDGSISGNWGRETAYNSSLVQEYRKSRWTLNVKHNHEVSPSFKYSVSGSAQSDKDYFNDYSTNLAERLNRVVRSSVIFSKRFSSKVALSGSLKHDEYLDNASRTDLLPSLSLSLPALRPFGSGSPDATGKILRHWYNEMIITYRPRLEHYSSRVTKDSLGYQAWGDTSADNGSSGGSLPGDLTIRPWDTVDYRTRKQYVRVDHSVSVNSPLTVAPYFVFNPNFGYNENWYKIYETDQSRDAGIDASTTYRAYAYSLGASLSTKLYGTVQPNLFGLVGLRQVISPQLSYRYVPEIDRHPVVSSYAGGAGRSGARSQSMTVSLGHVYQAKVRQGEGEKVLSLLSVNHSFSYDFEKDSLRFSNLSTSIRSNLLKNINLNASMTHSLYKAPNSSELDFWNPHMTYFRVNARVSLRGQRFLFDDIPSRIPRGADSASQVGGSSLPRAPIQGRKGWDVSATYNYSESGKWTNNFTKRSSIQIMMHFNLTPTTQVTYSQYYDFVGSKTITNQVNIVKTIHCWTGTFHWVPTGSTRGWGFRLYVTAIPAIKIDNSNSVVSSSVLQGGR